MTTVVEVSGSPRTRVIRDHFFRYGDWDAVRVKPDGTDIFSGVNVTYNLMHHHQMDDTHGHCFHDEDHKYFAYGDNGVVHTEIITNHLNQVRTVPIVALESLTTTTVYSPQPNSLLGTPGETEIYGLLPLPPSDLLDDLRRKAMKRFQTQIPVEVDGLPFLAELNQVVELVPRLLDTIGASIANGWLQWNFGAAPLLSDLRKLASIVDTVHNRMQFLRDTWGKKTRLHYSRSGFWDPPTLPFFAVIGESPFQGRATRDFYHVTFKAGAWLTHHLEGLNARLAELRAIGVALGFTSPIKAVWEEIPFSFVIDWLTEIGTVFGDMAITNVFSGDWWVRRPVQSLTVRGRLSLGQFTQWNTITGYHNLVSRGSIAVRRYHRWAGMPDAASLFDLSLVSPKQASFLLAISAGSRA